MSIKARKQKDGTTRYQVSYREPGIANPRRRTFRTKREARDFEVAVHRAKAGQVTPWGASTQTLESFGQEYLEKYALVELAPKTLQTYKAVWNKHIHPRLGAQPLGFLSDSSEIVQQFKADLVRDGIGDAALAKTLGVLSAVLNKAVEWNRIRNNPVSRIKKPSGKRKRPIRPIPPLVVEMLRAQLGAQDALLVSVLAYAGLRPGEALALTADDVQVRVIEVNKAASMGELKGTKTGYARTVPLLVPLAEDLRAGPRVGLLFPDPSGELWTESRYRNWRTRVFKPALVRVSEQTGEDWTKAVPYDLRHSLASLLLAEQRNPLEVAEAMGHSRKTLDSTYAHVIPELRGQSRIDASKEIRAARAKLDADRAQTVPTLELVAA